MIKLKDILLEGTAPDIFVPRRMEDRIDRMISLYVRNGSKGDLDLSGRKLTKLPRTLKDITVNGWLYCNENKLTSLENSPKIVNGNFYCSFNNLTSLEFAPKVVKRNFICHGNDVKFTEQDVRAVCDVTGTMYL